MSETTKSDKIRQLSQEQMNAIEHLLQGKSDRAVSEAAGVSRQTVWEWRNRDPLFIAELNRLVFCGGQRMTEPEALQDRRQFLLEQLSRAADEIRWVDERLEGRRSGAV